MEAGVALNVSFVYSNGVSHQMVQIRTQSLLVSENSLPPPVRGCSVLSHNSYCSHTFQLVLCRHDSCIGTLPVCFSLISRVRVYYIIGSECTGLDSVLKRRFLKDV